MDKIRVGTGLAEKPYERALNVATGRLGNPRHTAACLRVPEPVAKVSDSPPRL